MCIQQIAEIKGTNARSKVWCIISDFRHSPDLSKLVAVPGGWINLADGEDDNWDKKEEQLAEQYLKKATNLKAKTYLTIEFLDVELIQIG